MALAIGVKAAAQFMTVGRNLRSSGEGLRSPSGRDRQDDQRVYRHGAGQVSNIDAAIDIVNRFADAEGRRPRARRQDGPRRPRQRPR